MTNTPEPTDKRWRPVENAMRRNGYQAGGLIEALHAVQRSYGYIDETAMRTIAAALTLPLSKVYGVATFYHFFHLKPKGRHTCVVCLGTACYIKGADQLLQETARNYGIKPGETSADGYLSLLTARCVGACGQAPAVVVDERVLGQADTVSLADYLGQLPRGDNGENRQAEGQPTTDAGANPITRTDANPATANGVNPATTAVTEPGGRPTNGQGETP